MNNIPGGKAEEHATMTEETPETPDLASDENRPPDGDGAGKEREAPDQTGPGPEEEKPSMDVPPKDVPPGPGELEVNGDKEVKEDVEVKEDAEVKEAAEADSSSNEDEEISSEDEVLQLRLSLEKLAAVHANVQLQTKLVEFLSKTSWDGGQQQEAETAAPESELLREYEEHVDVLERVKRQLAADAEAAQRVEETLRAEYRQMSEKVEGEWRAHLAELGRCMGRHAPQAEVDATLALEQVRQDKLIKLRVQHIKLRWRVQRMEAALRKGGNQGMDRLQLQFEYVLAARRRQKKVIEKQCDEGARLQGKINNSLELLSNFKEKLFWSQAQIRSRGKELAELEATLIQSKDALTATKHTMGRLQRNNQKMKENRGLLGQRDLLGDFEVAVDGAEGLELHLEKRMDYLAQLSRKLSG